MPLATTRFDPADYIRDADGLEEYLLDAFETEDPAIITDALGVVGRSKGMSDLASQVGVTRQSLYKALSKDGNPEFSTVLKVAHALGFRLTLAPLETV